MESKLTNRYLCQRHIANKTDSLAMRNHIKTTVRGPRNLRAVVCSRPVSGGVITQTSVLLCEAAGIKNSFVTR